MTFRQTSSIHFFSCFFSSLQLRARLGLASCILFVVEKMWGVNANVFCVIFGNYFVRVVSATLTSVCSDCAMPSVRKKSIVPTSSGTPIGCNISSFAIMFNALIAT